MILAGRILSVWAFAGWLILLSPFKASTAETKISWWNTHRKGANWFNAAPSLEWLVAAKSAGIQVVRLAPTKWKSSRRDFLVGDADHYQGLVEDDLARLKSTLDQADSLGLKVVLTTLTLPGARWTQQNGGTADLRLWRDTTYHRQAAQFWRDLATRLRGHPAIAAYNILNEPIPEVTAGIRSGDPDAIEAWYDHAKHTPADLNDFYTMVISAIRQVDPETPIVLDCGLWSQTDAIGYLKPAEDRMVLYAIHCYDPYEYTNKKANNGRFAFPGPLPSADSVSDKKLDTDWLEEHFNPVIAWQMKYGIPSTRIFIEEFGCHRQSRGAANYLRGLIDIFERQSWHWAFYAFREDFWDGMDYEMGARPAGEQFWKDVELGVLPHPARGPNPIWNVLQSALNNH